MKFICDTCGKEVTPEEGTLSWVDEEMALRDFRITHKKDQNHSCAPQHVAYVHLWIVTGIAGFVKFTQMLTDQWEKGYALKDPKGLKKALDQIGNHLWEKTKKPLP